MQRRMFALALGSSLAGLATTTHAKNFNGADGIAEAVAAAESVSGGRLGVCILDTATGRRFGHRADERFPMCSTFKWLATACVLQRVDAGREQLARPIAIPRSAILPHSPSTEPRVGGRMTMAELCEAAITQSDNAAANLMLASFGGPAGLTRYLRGLGDKLTRLDRNEPSLNESTPGDPRDTTTPAAMLGLLQTLLIGDALKPASRDQLRDWLLANQTGEGRLRARLPAGWRVGDKTGSGAHGSHNDVGIVFPPGRPPLLVATYLTQTAATLEQRNATLAAVGALLPAMAGA
ncbi:MAG: class A beta-lactamase [Pseudomonadota bacterium]